MIWSPSALLELGLLPSLLLPSGEMGMVDRSTGSEGLASPLRGAWVAVAAMAGNVDSEERRSSVKG